MSIRRGEIYFVSLDPVQGKEQSGQRPVLIFSIDAINQLPLVITVIPGTKGKNIPADYPTNVRVSPSASGLPIETAFCAFKHVPSIELDFSTAPQVSSLEQKCWRLKLPFGIALDDDLIDSSPSISNKTLRTPYAD